MIKNIKKWKTIRRETMRCYLLHIMFHTTNACTVHVHTVHDVGEDLFIYIIYRPYIIWSTNIVRRRIYVLHIVCIGNSPASSFNES